MAKLHPRDDCKYDELPGINMSTLLAMRKSPKHYQYRLAHPRKPTTAMELGTLTHVAILEPERFLREFVMWEATDSETGKTRQRRGKSWEAFQAQHDGKTIVRDTEYEQAIRLQKAVRKDRTAMRYLAVGEPEVSLSWRDKETGLGCRGRIDWITDIDGMPFIVDVKTTRDAAPWAFARDAAKLDYHVRLAFYADGHTAATGRVPGVAIVAVENTPPYDVVTYIVPGDALEVGRIVYGRLLEQLQNCMAANYWPGVGMGEEKTFQLPAWVTPEAEEEEVAIQWDQ